MLAVLMLAILLNVVGNLEEHVEVFIPFGWIIFICWTLFYVGKLFIMLFI